MPIDKEKTINFKDILAIVAKRKWLIIIPLIIVAGLAYGGTYLLEPKYRSSTIIWIDEPGSVSRELVQIIGRERSFRETGEERRRKIQSLQNELTSQTYLNQLIDQLDLDQDPALTRKAAKMREDNPMFSLEQLKQHLLIDKLRSQIGVGFVGADHIMLSVEAYDPVKARDLVTALAGILEKEKTKYELEKILDNQSFADLQLQKTEYHYQQALDSLTEAQSRYTELRLPENIASEENRREIVTDIDKTQLEIDDMIRERDNLRSRLAALDLDGTRLKYTDSIVDLRTEIDGQLNLFADMMQKYAWDEQNLINVNIRLVDNLRKLENALTEAVNDQFESYPDDQRRLLEEYFVVEENLDVLRSRKARLQSALDNINDRINLLPKLGAELAELERKVNEARKYRDAFRSEEATVSILSEQAKERTKYKIIEPARVPLEPFWPDRIKILMMGLVLGLMLGGSAVFLAEIFDNSIKKTEDVEQYLELSVLATIPRIERLKSIRR